MSGESGNLGSFSFKSSECLERDSQQPEQESVETEVSFTSRIEKLQADKAKLTNELNQWRHQAERAKEEVNRLTKTMQSAKQQDAQKMALMAEYCRKITIKSFQDLNRVFEKFGFTAFSNEQDMGWMIPQDAFCQSKETSKETKWKVAETGDQNTIML